MSSDHEGRAAVRPEAEGSQAARLGDRAPELMGALVRETFRAMVEQVEHQFDDTDLALSQWLALKLIRDGTIGCIGDINRELGLESGTSTRLADQLEKRGFISRRRCRDDRRVVRLAITGPGMAVIDEMQPRLAGFWRDRLSVFTPDERALMFDLISRLRDRLLARAPDPSSGASRSKIDPS